MSRAHAMLPHYDPEYLERTELPYEDFAALVEMHAYEEAWLTEALEYAHSSGDWLYVGRQWKKHMGPHIERAIGELA